MEQSVEVEPGVIIEMRDGKVKKGKLRNRRLSIISKTEFLDHLAATCNVQASAQAANVCKSTAYRLRRRDAEFAQQWQEALEVGYTVLETLLVGRAIKALQPEIGVTAVPDPDSVTTETALRILDRHYRSVKTSVKTGGPIPRRASEEEARDAILAKLDILQKRIEAGEA